MLVEAQLDQIDTQRDLKDAELQVVYAQAVDAHIEAYDDSRFRAARAKAELKFQRARADVGQAEARYAAHGGTDVPDPMIIVDSPAAPDMGPASTPGPE